jgi:hypothetical protein
VPGGSAPWEEVPPPPAGVPGGSAPWGRAIRAGMAAPPPLAEAAAEEATGEGRDAPPMKRWIHTGHYHGRSLSPPPAMDVLPPRWIHGQHGGIGHTHWRKLLVAGRNGCRIRSRSSRVGCDDGAGAHGEVDGPAAWWSERDQGSREGSARAGEGTRLTPGKQPASHGGR